MLVPLNLGFILDWGVPKSWSKTGIVPFTNKLKSATCTKLLGHMHLLPLPPYVTHTRALHTHTHKCLTVVLWIIWKATRRMWRQLRFLVPRLFLFLWTFPVSPSIKNSRELTSTLYVVGPRHDRHLVPQVATRHEMLPK